MPIASPGPITPGRLRCLPLRPTPYAAHHRGCAPVTRALVSGVVALIIAIVLGGPVVRALEARKLGKAISEYLPSSHQIKAGVPTMGGLIIFLTVLLVTVPFNLAGRWSILL